MVRLLFVHAGCSADGRSSSMIIESLYLSPHHNFFGHHGVPPGTSAALQREEIECVAGRGIRGDRFFDYKPGYKGQITFFSAEVFEALCTALGATDRSPAAVRRNVLIRGFDLNAWIGTHFELQGVHFLGTEECRPCYWMDQAIGRGAESWLKGRGGLRAQILSDGRLTAERPARSQFFPASRPAA